MIDTQLAVTAAADKFIRRMVRFSQHPTGGFRLTVAPGGCSGYSSEFTVESAPRAGDAEVVVNGATKLYLPAESRLLLSGVTIDFAETPTSSGLVFINPNQAACGCSSSSDAAPPAEASVTVGSIKRMAKV